ncbi:hypothetical protein [Spiroplasma endosymbiont of Seladonia tumulorum]|uniref:hypothetical protein n=1 Tax=Spiroplasma endosymbiont of Seladonia tumulorum TaxID=3066321 RepID=UPI0030D377B4
MGFFSKVVYKFHRTKHKRNKKYYLLKNRKALTVNSIPQDINIHVIKIFREKFTSLIQPNDITMKDGYLLRKVRGFNSFGIFYQLDVIFAIKILKLFKQFKILDHKKWVIIFHNVILSIVLLLEWLIF